MVNRGVNRLTWKERKSWLVEIAPSTSQNYRSPIAYVYWYSIIEPFLLKLSAGYAVDRDIGLYLSV